MAKKQTKRVYIPQVDKIFDSISAAARAIGVNAANLSKVISGKRKSVGGYNAISAEQYQRGGKTIKPNRLSLRRKAEKLGIAIGGGGFGGSPELAKLRDLLEDVNTNTRQIRKNKISYFAEYNRRALGFLDDIGRSSTGLYDTSYENLKSLDAAEVKKYTEAIEAFKKHDTFTAAGAERAATVRADHLGLTVDQARKYSDILPTFLDLIDSITNAQYKYREIINAVIDAINDQAPPDRVLRIMAQYADEYNATDFISNWINTATTTMSRKQQRNLDKLLDQYNMSPDDPTIRSSINIVLAAIRTGVKPDLIGKFAGYAITYDTDDYAASNIEYFDQAIQNDQADDIGAYITDLLKLR